MYTKEQKLEYLMSLLKQREQGIIVPEIEAYALELGLKEEDVQCLIAMAR